jgi:hypothetical protein
MFTQAERIFLMGLVADKMAADLKERNRLFIAYGPGDEWERVKKQYGWDSRKATMVSINDKLTGVSK